MGLIFSREVLQRGPSQVNSAARDSDVRIVERENAALVARLSKAVGRGVADVKAGRYTTSIEDAFARARELRGRRA